MQKTFLSSLSLIVLLNLLVKPIYIFGIDTQVQNAVGHSVYGNYFYLLNLSYLLNLITDLGINNYTNRSVAQSKSLIIQQFDKLFAVKGLLSLAYAGITLLIGYTLNLSAADYHLLLLLVFNQVLVSLIQFVRSNLTGRHFFKSDSVVSILDRLILIICCGILLYTQVLDHAFEIAWFVYLQTFAYAITLLVALICLGGDVVKFRFSIDWAFAKYIIRRSAPFAIFMLSAALYNRIDSIMLMELREDGDLQLGNYAQGFRFYEAAGMFALLFANILLPIYARLIAKREDVQPIMAMASRLLTGFAVVGAIFMLFQGRYVLDLFFDVVTEESTYSFQALMVAFIGLAWFYIYGTLLTANADLKLLNIIALISLAVNVVMNYLLIPKYGAFGAALATMITQLFCGGYQMLVVVRKFRFRWNFNMIGQFIVLSLGYFGLLYGLNLLPIQQVWLVVIGFSFGPILLLLSGFMDIKRLRMALRESE